MNVLRHLATGNVKHRLLRDTTQHERLSRRPLGSKNKIIVGVVIPLCLCLCLLPAASASTALKSKTCVTKNGVKITDPVVCTGLAFYAGKTITLDVPSAAGSGFDSEYRAVASYMQEYLGASIETTDYASGASIPGQDALAHSVPNGLTFGVLELGSDALDIAVNVPALNFNPEHEDFLGSFPPPPFMLEELASEPYASFQALADHPPAASDPLRIVSTSDNWATLQLNLYLRAFGIPFSNIFGYTNSTTQVAGFARGDGPFIFQTPSILVGYSSSGYGRALAINGKIKASFPDYSSLESVPTFSALFSSEKHTTANEKTLMKWAQAVGAIPQSVLATPTKTPTTEVTTLRAAYDYAMHLAPLEATLALHSIPHGNITGTAAKAIYVKDLPLMAKAAKVVGGIS